MRKIDTLVIEFQYVYKLINVFTARREGQSNSYSVFIQVDGTESKEFLLFEKNFICELQIRIDFCMISYYYDMVRFRTKGGYL